MAKTIWKPGTFIYPIPAVMVSCGDMEKSNIITVAWTGILNTNPAMCYISVRPERYSYNIIKKTGEFVINLTTKDLAYATDWCGVKSGKNFDKFKEMKLTKEKSNFVKCPAIKESPVSVECRVKEIKELRKSHYVYGGGIINKCRWKVHWWKRGFWHNKMRPDCLCKRKIFWTWEASWKIWVFSAEKETIKKISKIKLWYFFWTFL